MNLETIYRGMEPAISELVGKFANKGLDSADLRSSCHIGFMEAVYSWNEKKATFSTWAYTCMRSRCYDALRKFRRQLKAENLDLRYTALAPVEFDVLEFCDSLSREAQIVVQTLLQVPPDLRLALAEKRQINVRTIRSALRQCLRELGWSTQEIWRSFHEIKEALEQ